MIKLKELVEQVGVEKVLGKHLVHRVFPVDCFSAIITFLVTIDGTTYEVVNLVGAEDLDSWGFRIGKDCECCIVAVFDGDIVWLADDSRYKGFVYCWDSEGFWELDSDEKI
jgi:hypothetical protein